MGNLFTTNVPAGSPNRMPMQQSVFELRQRSEGTKQMSCDVVFGSPNADCHGTGVCKISASAALPNFNQKPRSCQSTAGILFPLEGGFGVSLVIARELMCIKLLRTQFRGNVLTLHEPCRLPNDIITSLSLKFRDLKPGKYELEVLDGFFRINFR